MAKGIDFDELFPGRFIKAGDFHGREVTLTIAAVRIEELPSDQGGMRAKGIIGFDRAKKEWVLNRTNGESLKAMWGRDTGEWIGKRVTLYPAEFNGDIAIRVRGSPDLPADLPFELKLPRKRAQRMVLKKTGANGASKPAAAAASETREVLDQAAGLDAEADAT